jgi:hypothetical protein
LPTSKKIVQVTKAWTSGPLQTFIPGSVGLNIGRENHPGPGQPECQAPLRGAPSQSPISLNAKLRDKLSEINV